MSPSAQPILLSGPTAVGKSELAMVLAEKIGGEIISVDSMQVYIGLDIGTAKPSAHEQERIPHHGIDLLDLYSTHDAAQFVQMAQKAVDNIQQRNKVPIFCGGTGFYLSTYLYGINDAPPTDPELRRSLETLPCEVLLEEIKSKDHETWQRIDKQNPRRLLRAVEVMRLTGKPFSSFRKPTPPIPPTDLSKRMFWIERDAMDLRNRIDQRTRSMFKNGLVEETQRFLDQGLRDNKVARNAIGYKQVIRMLDENMAPEAVIEEIRLRTWQFARRQRTWHRNQLHFPTLLWERATYSSQILDTLIAHLEEK